ncbi:MAG: hypothetical protein H7263_19335, partial [Candidatus Sericytochromatia bacterium]|nr:hypothetical protein [Candidatus Sericytochromatia bacterium]
MNKKLILSAVLTSILAAPSAFAGSVVNWTGSDGFSAEPYVKGTNMAQIRLDSGFTGSSPTNALIPGLSFTTAFADGFDMGIGGNLNFSGIGSSASSYASSALFPWIRAAVPLGIENVKTGIMVGTSIPLNSTGQLNQGGHNLNMNMMTN